MNLRITPQTMLANALDHLQQHTSRLGKLQEQAATGKKLLLPSDNPVGLGQLLSNRAQDGRLDHYLASIRSSRTSLNASVSALLDAGDIVTQARTLAVEAGQSTNTPEALEAIAKQVNGLVERLLHVANTQHDGRYLFAGAASKTKPFSLAAASIGGAPGAVYHGEQGRDAVAIGPGQIVATLYGGDAIFQARQRGVTAYHGATGTAPGQGLDSATGQGTLLVRHTLTTYAAGSGVQAGTGSAAGDTILGPIGAHQLTVSDTSGTGTAGTVSLNGGAAIAFTSGDTNLKVTGPQGEIVFLDTTSITAGFSGTVAITADGTFSSDGGASTTAIDFSANQVIIDSATGAVTNVEQHAGSPHRHRAPRISGDV